MGKQIKLTAGDGFELGAYRAEPTGTPKAGLVLLQELFGVNEHIRSVADRFAEDGYLVIAPALFDRVEPELELGYTPDALKRAQALRSRLDPDKTMADVAAAVAEAGKGGKVLMVGYCWGGLLVFLAAADLPGVTAGTCYYGGGIANHLDRAPQIPLIMHFGERDTNIPLEQVDKIRAALPDVPIYTYPAGHGFNCNARGSYDAASADLALERTRAFFDAQLG